MLYLELDYIYQGQSGMCVWCHDTKRELVHDLHYWSDSKRRKIMVTIVNNMKDQDSYLFTLKSTFICKRKGYIVHSASTDAI